MSQRIVKLLHVEDEPSQHKALMIRLRAANELKFETTWVKGEHEALESYAPGRFDIIIVDYLLDEGNGLHLLKEIRARDSKIPIIALSGAAQSSDGLQLIRSGVTDIFDKSEMDTRQLIRSIQNAIDRVSPKVQLKVEPVDFQKKLCEFSQRFSVMFGQEFMCQLQEIEKIARNENHTEADFINMIAKIDLNKTDSQTLLTRMALCEIFVRLFGSSPPTNRIATHLDLNSAEISQDAPVVHTHI